LSVKTPLLANTTGVSVAEAPDWVSGEARDLGQQLASKSFDFIPTGTDSDLKGQFRDTVWITGGETTVTFSDNNPADESTLGERVYRHFPYCGDAKGGRCQEAALAWAVEVLGRAYAAIDENAEQQIVEGGVEKWLTRNICGGYDISCLFAGTDGTDGPNDAAGGCVSSAGLWRVCALVHAIEMDDEDCNVHEGAFKRSVRLFLEWSRFALETHASYGWLGIMNRLVNGIYHIRTGPTNTNVMDVYMISINQIK
jgi:glycerate-2-kinase